MKRFFERDKRTGHRRPIDPETLGVGVEFSGNPERPVRATGGGVLGRIAQRNFDAAYAPREYPETNMELDPVVPERPAGVGGGVLGGGRRRGGAGRAPSAAMPEVPETPPAPQPEPPAPPSGARDEAFEPWDGGGDGGRMPSLPGHEVWKAPEEEERMGGGKAFGVGARAHAGSALGAMAGGAALGAAVGSLIPVAGTAAGAVLGAVGVGVATLAGALGGGWLGGKAQNKIEERAGVKEKWEKELSLARQQHPYATFGGEIGTELAGMAAGNWGAGAMRAARGGKVALDAAKAAERLNAMAKEGKDVAAARRAIDAYRTAQQNAEAAKKATRAARGAKKIAEEQAKLKEALAAVEATERAAREAAAANGVSLVGERAANALKAGRRLENATVAGARMAGEGSPSDYTMPEADTPCGRLLTESEAGEWARQENRILGGDGDAWWNGLAAGLRDPWRGREKLKRVPFLGHWLNTGIEREMEGRKRRLSENGYMRPDGTFDWELKREDERKIVAQRNRDLVNAAKSKSIAYSAANLISTQPTFWAEIGMSPTVLKMPGFADVRGMGGVARYGLRAVVNGLAQAQFSPGGVAENYARNRARKWTIRQDAFDALDLTVEREGDGALRALWKAWVRNNNEYVSEHLGEVLNLAGLKVVNRALPQGLARKLTRLIDDTAEPTTFLHRLFRASGVQPAFEMAEERLNDMMNVALHADDNDEGKSFGRRMFEAAWPGPRQLLTEMLGFAGPAAAKLTAGAVLNRRWGDESGRTDGGTPAGGGTDGGGVEAESAGGPRWTPTAEAFAGWRERITATLDAAGRTDAAERIRNAANPDDLMDALGNAIGQMLQDGFERMLTPDQRQALDGLQGEERLVAAAQLATSWNEMERGLLAAANILERGDLGDEAAQRAVDALCQLKPEWRDALRDGMEPHEALSAILLAATDEIRDGTLDLADSKWKDAGAAALAASVSDRENDAIGDITLDALVGALNATQREEYDSLGTAGEKVAYLDSMLRGLGGQNAGVFTVARHIAGLDDGANVPEKMLDATISQLQAQFPGHASAATGGTKREQLRALVRSIEADERNKEILRVFTEEGRLPDVADEGDFGAPIDELGGEEEAAAANPPAGEPPAPPAAGEALASQVPGMPVPDTSSLSPEGREALEAQARERLNEGARQDAAPPNAAPQNAAPREAESPEAARRRQALSRRQARKRKGGLKFRTDYDAMGADALRQECRKRGISPEGTEEELRALIEEDDIRATHGAILGKRFEEDGALKTIAENAMKALKGIGVLKGIEFRDIYTADGGRAHGAFNQPSGILYLSRDCRTDTLAHEIRHVLWQATQVSTDAKMRKLHQAFRRIAESAPEAVKRLVVAREGAGLLDDEDRFLNEVFAACGELSGAHDFLGALHSHAAARTWWGRVHAAAKRLVDGAVERYLPFLKTVPRYANVENALLALSEDILAGREIDFGAVADAAEREEKAGAEARQEAAPPATEEPAPILSGDEVRKGMPGYDPGRESPAAAADTAQVGGGEQSAGGEPAATTSPAAEPKGEAEKPRPEKGPGSLKGLPREEQIRGAAKIIADTVNDKIRRNNRGGAVDPNKMFKPEDLMQSAVRIVDAIESKDANKLRGILHNGNKGSIRAFEAIAGVKLPGAQSARFVAVDRFFGVTPEERARRDAEKKAEFEAKNAEERHAAIIEQGKRIAMASKIAMPDGKRTVTLDKGAKELFEQGWKLTSRRRGAITEYALFNPEGTRGYKIPAKAREYLEDLADRVRAEKRDEEPDDLSDIDAEEVREELEKGGIVNGQVVNPAAAENNDFIQQVERDAKEIGKRELRDRLLDAIETDARDGLVGIVQDNRYGEGAYAINYATGSREEVTRAADGIRKAFPDMEVMSSDDGIVIVPKTADQLQEARDGERNAVLNKSPESARVQGNEEGAENHGEDARLGRSGETDGAGNPPLGGVPAQDDAAIHPGGPVGAGSADRGAGDDAAGLHGGDGGRPGVDVGNREGGPDSDAGGGAPVGVGAGESSGPHVQEVGGAPGLADESSELAGGRSGGQDAGSGGDSVGVDAGERPGVKETAGKAAEGTKVAAPKHPDFVMTDGVRAAILEKSPLKRVRNNIKALKLLRKLRAEGRQATPKEQETLAKFVGWGGLSQIFDAAYGRQYDADTNGGAYYGRTDFTSGTKFGREGYELYKEIRETLTDAELARARGSTLSAFYTPVEMVMAEHDALRALGVRGGRFLGPSAGTGNYASAAGVYEKGLIWQFVELDPTTGGILQQLFPNQRVIVDGYEKTSLPNSYYDVAIDNVPYVDAFIRSDRDYPPMKVHDYFFAKTISKLRPGGVMMFLTSTGTLDKQSATLRKYLSDHGGQIVGAVRLPNGFFSKNAGTDVAADLVIVQKRDGAVDNSAFEKAERYGTETAWERGRTVEKPLTYNGYFKDHPEQIVGEMKTGTGQYGRALLEYKMPKSGLYDLVRAAIGRAMDGIDRDALLKSPTVAEVQDHTPVYDDEGLRQGNVTEKNGKFWVKTGGELVPVALPTDAKLPDGTPNKGSMALRKALDKRKLAPEAVMRELLGLRSALRAVVDAQMKGCTDAELASLQKKLNTVYDNFVKRNGNLTKDHIKPFVLLDGADGNRMLALELTDNTKVWKADIFTKRVIFKSQRPTKADTPMDAMVIAYSETGTLDVRRVGELLGTNAAEAERRLRESGDVFENPQTGRIEASWQYLSGKVRTKLAAARAAAEQDPAYAPNVKALEKVVPKDIPIGDVKIQFGATWVDPEAMTDFIRDQFGSDRVGATFTYNNDIGMWASSLSGAMSNPWGETTMDVDDFLSAAMNNRSLDHWITTTVGGERVREFDAEGTEKNKLAKERLDSAFEVFLQTSEKWHDRAERRYNDVMNDLVPTQLPAGVLPFEAAGMARDSMARLFETDKDGKPDVRRPKKGREYQSAAIAKGVLGGQNLYLAHAVGAGKTMEMQSISMLGRHLGIFRKPIHVVPNHMLNQYCNEWLRDFPNANILKMTDEDVKPENRRRFFAMVANGDWDAIVVKRDTFSRKLAMGAEYQRQYYEDMLENFELAYEAAREAAGKGDETVKEMEKRLLRLRERVEKKQAALESSKDSKIIPFEELGVDQIFVDEAHNYKGLSVATSQGRVKGLSQGESSRAEDMEMKCDYIQSLRGDGQGCVFASGTSLSNAPVLEAYGILRFLAKRTLDEQGMKFFDAFVSQFGTVESVDKMDMGGTGTKEAVEVTGLRNAPELMRLFKSVVDIVNSEDLKLPRPSKNLIPVKVNLTPMQRVVMHMVARECRLSGGKEDMGKMMKLANIAKSVCISPRLLGMNEDGGKLAALARNVKKTYDETRKELGTQLVFTDKFNQSAHSTISGMRQYMNEAERNAVRWSGETGEFDLNRAIVEALVAQGIPRDEIAVIQDLDRTSGDKDQNKAALFKKVKDGKVRVLVGSRPRMGEGTNVQDRLAAIHMLHPGWKPSEDEQAEGRIIRPGNRFKEGRVYYYLTQGDEDIGSYETSNHELVGKKSALINRIMRGDASVRDLSMNTAEDERDLLMSMTVKNPELGELIAMRRPLRKLELDVANSRDLARRKASDADYRAKRLSTDREEYGRWEKRVQDWNGKHKAQPLSITAGGKKRAKPGEMATLINGAMEGLRKKPVYSREQTEIGTIDGSPVVVRTEPVSVFGTVEKAIKFGIPELDFWHMLDRDVSPQGMVQIIRHLDAFLSPESLKRRKGELDGMAAQIEKMRETAKEFAKSAEEKGKELGEKKARELELNRRVFPLPVYVTQENDRATYGNWGIIKARDGWVASQTGTRERIEGKTLSGLLDLIDAADRKNPSDAAKETVNLGDYMRKRGLNVPVTRLERKQVAHAIDGMPEEEQGEGGEAEEGTTVFQLPSRDWSTAKIPDMRRELARRGLNVQGNAAMLRARLEGDDDRRRVAGGGTMFQKATPAEAARLDREPTVRVYRAMQLVDGKLYPPMAAKVNGKWVEPTELGTWYVADEHPEVAFEVKGKWYVQLDKGNGRKLSKVAYNPYFHTSRTPLNDQFSSASERPELVMVECEVPESELTSDYHAEKAKDSVGEKDWHSGPVAGWLAEKGHRRKVILSRYAKVVRVVRDSEVAEEVQRMLDGTGISIPEGVVTPALRAELERLGVDISRQTRSAYSWEKIAGTKKNPRTMEIPQFKRGAFAENATQRDMLKVARKSVSDAGGRETASGLVLDIPAFGEVVVVGRSGIVHGLRPYLHYGLVVHKDNADILPVLGKVLSNAIPVNEVRARGDDPKGTTGSTLLLSAAHDEAGEIVPIVVVVNHIRHEKEGLPEIRVYPLKSVNAKNPPSRRGLPPSLTSVGFSKINVGELVGQIKDEVPIFSQDVYGHFKQERPYGDFGSMMFQKTSPGEEWNGARVEQQKRRNGRVAWNVVKEDGTVLERGLRSEEAAKEALARGASRLDLLEEEVAKLKKKDAAAIAEARRALVESLAKKDATAEERVAAFRELARNAGIHESLAEKEWNLAEKILSQETTEGVEEAYEKAERAVGTVLARASIREYQNDIKELGKQGGGVLRENGMRVNELAEVREAMKAIRADAAPKAVKEKVSELLDQEQELLDRVTSGMDADGVALSDAQLERAVAEYVKTVTKRQIAQNFLGLLKNHGGTHRERLLEDLAAWRRARETMEKLARDAKSALESEQKNATERAKEIRQELIKDFTGGRGVPKAMQRKAFENTMTLREKAVRWWRGIVAYHMSGGREWGEFLTQGPGEYRETAAGRLLHDGLAVAQKREMEANEADQERALRLLSGQFHIDPGKGFKELIDLSEICGKLFSDTIGTDASGRPEVTLRSAIYDKRKFGGKRREVLGYQESVCKLKLGELMSIYLYGKQAEALAGVGSGGFTDTPAHSEWADTSLMESLAMNGYSAETMAEIRRALEARGLDRLALAISADMETKSDALDGVMQKHFHSHLVRIPFYAPLRRVHYGADERFDAKASVGGFMGLARSFLKERVTNYRDIQPSNLIDLWQNHNRQANHLITHSDWTAEVGRVFRHTQMQEALEWTVGGKARKYLNSWLDLQASGGQYRRIESPAFDAIARRFASAVTINPRVALKQLTSGTMALSMLPPEASTVQWAKDMAYIAIPGKALKFHRMLMAESAEWRQRGSNASDAQMLVNRHVAGSKASLRNMKINRALSIMTRFGDRGGALMGCYGVYMAWKRKFEGEGMGEREAHEAALERFIDAVNAGQQSSRPEYMSFAQTAGRGFRFFYMFKTAQAAMTKNFFLHADALVKHRGPPKQHIRGMLGIYLADVLFKMMGMAMMPLLVMAGLGGGGDDDEKRKRQDKEEWRAEKAALQSLVDAPFGGLLFAGDLASAVTDHFLARAGHAAGKENAPRMFDAAEKLLPSFDVWNDAVMGVDKLTAGDIKAAAKFAIDATAKFAGAPYASIAWDYLTDDLPDAIGDSDLSITERIARGLTFSRSAIGAPKKKAQ